LAGRTLSKIRTTNQQTDLDFIKSAIEILDGYNSLYEELSGGRASTVYADVKIKGQDEIITLSHPIVLTEEGPRLLPQLLETQG